MAKSSSLKTAPSLYYTRPAQICKDKIFYHEPGSNSKLQSKKFTLFLACLPGVGYSLSIETTNQPKDVIMNLKEITATAIEMAKTTGASVGIMQGKVYIMDVYPNDEMHHVYARYNRVKVGSSDAREWATLPFSFK